ncbi:Tn3 family transposase [Streptomyces sp. NPDC085944]|uniref:Tn3 family transposase n=1 Tax=Streptomyces sp. NPDC085944 TaxID=3154962 RepID=UPI00342B644D
MSPGRSSPLRPGPATCCGAPACSGRPGRRRLRAAAERWLTVQDSRRFLPRDPPRLPGQFRQAYLEEPEDRLASLGLVLTTVALRNTRSLDAVVAQLPSGGHDVKDEAVARLSPL